MSSIHISIIIMHQKLKLKVQFLNCFIFMHIQLITHNYQIQCWKKTLVDLRYLVVFKFFICTFAMEQILGSWYKYHCSLGIGLIRCMEFHHLQFFFFSLWGFADFFTSLVDFLKSPLCFSQLDVTCAFEITCRSNGRRVILKLFHWIKNSWVAM